MRSCPMCGAPNDAQSDTCTRCGARLVRLVTEEDDARTQSLPAAATTGDATPAFGDEEEAALPGASAETPDMIGERDPVAASRLSRLFGHSESSGPEGAPVTDVPVDRAKSLESPETNAEPSGTVNNGEKAQEIPPHPVDEEAKAHDLVSAEAEIPDWLKDPLVETPSFAGKEGEEEAPAPDWLRREAVPPAEVSPEDEWDSPGGKGPETAEELPSWLQGPEELTDLWPEAAEKKSEPELATLPDWLKSLQPEAASFADQVEEAIRRAESSSGLLAGVGAGLTVEPIIAMPHMTVPVEAMSVVEDARAGRLLKGLLSGRKPPAAAAVEERGGWPWRAIGHLVLLLILMVPLLSNSKLFNVEHSAPAAQALFNTVEAIPSGSLVLMAFDYESDLSGEMDPQAQAIMRHLRRRNDRIAAVSVVPQGPFMAQEVWQRVAADQAESAYGSEFVNMGFNVGREIGLRSLVRSPLNLSRKDFTGARSLRDYEMFKGVRGIEDVRLIVLVAASPESVRWWIEQVGSSSPHIPIVAAVSASVEPAVRPYLEAGQLRGLIAGLIGAADYDLQSGRPPAGEAAIDALTLGSAAVVLLIGLGAIVALKSSRKRGQKD